METEWHVTVKFPYDNTMYICVNVYKYSKSINVEGKTAHGFLLMIASGRWEREYSANRLYLTCIISKNTKPVCSDSNSVAKTYVSHIYLYIYLCFTVFLIKKGNMNSIPCPSSCLLRSLDANLW